MLLSFHTHKPCSSAAFKLVWRWSPHDDAHLQSSSKAPPGNTAGFTLPELLIALAVFLSVMGGVALLFVNSMRVTRQGFLNQEAFEEAQSALKIIEADLTRAFTSRQYGDYYQFYGTPIGFTFVGLASRDERDVPNLSRITYVVYRNAPTELERTDGEAQFTYSLLRYVEPGRDTLDDFPVQWDQVLLKGESSVSVQDLINQAIGAVRVRLCPNRDEPCLQFFDRHRETIESTLKRELWLQLLAGGNADIPDAWEIQNVIGDNGRPVVDLGPRYQTPAEIGFTTNPVDTAPGEYVVTEHLVNVLTQGAASAPNVEELALDLGINQLPEIVDDSPFPDGDDRYFFTYADFLSNGQQVRAFPRKFWNDWRNLLANTPDDEINAVGSPLLPRIPARVTTHFTLFFESPYPNVPDFIETFYQAIDIPTGYRRYRAE